MRIRVLLSSFLLSLPLAAQASWSRFHPASVPPGRNEGVLTCHDAAANPFGLSASNAVVATFGVR